MKVGILTYYNVHNHGAVLQANALKKVLEKNGCECSFLTFERNYDYTPNELIKKYRISLSSIPFFIKYSIKRGISNILFNVIKNYQLNRYRNKNFVIGDRYTDYKGDLVIVGSDEVFSLEVGINPFFYGHGLCTSLVSYAATFGPTSYDYLMEHNLDKLVSSGLSKFNSISVRDRNSFEILNKLGIKSEIVCDPVILYGYENEINEYKPSIDNYIVIYSYDKNLNEFDEIRSIKSFARSKGLKIISVGYHHEWCDKNVNVTPIQLLGYFKNASFVITDTFHGAVLSIICNTQFIVKIRENSNKLSFLLEEYGLLNRITSNFEKLDDLYNKSIDYFYVNKIVFDKREKSLKNLYEYLRFENQGGNAHE